METLLQQQAVEQLHLALSVIADGEKADLLEALRVAPHLVATESDPFRFLSFKNYDTWAAAQALVTYWKRRREIFGARAFLPMTITGDGAMTMEDIAYLRAGYLLFLPDDDHGRTVVCIDSSRKLNNSLEKRIRSAFYISQVASETESSQTEGVVAIVLIRLLRHEPGSPQVHALVKNTFPMKVKTFHMVNCLPYSSAFWILQVFLNAIVRFFQHITTTYKTSIHASRNEQQTLQELESHGLRKEGLPVEIGGSWSYDSFPQWLAYRERVERERMDRFSIVVSPIPASSSAPTLTDMPVEGQAPILQNDEAGVQEGANNTSHDEVLKKEMQRLPANTAAPYLEAVSNARPQIWEEEVDASKFLRVEHFNKDFAAKRLTKYWKLRGQLFGSKRYESLYQTGEDALGKKDVMVLISGFLNIHPNDNSGCPVLYIDGTRLPAGSVNASRDRCLFYMFSILAESEESQREGIVLLYRVEKEPFSRIDVRVLANLAVSLPLRFKSVHLLSHHKVSSDTKKHFGFAKEVHLHFGASKGAVLEKLLSFGLKKAGLPKSFDGDWGYSKFIQWGELRSRMEFRVPLGLSGRENIDQHIPGVRNFGVLSDAEKRERTRRLNVIHCRRNRHRILVEADILREESEGLKREQEELLKQNHDLQDLLRQAKHAARTHSDTATTGPQH